MPRAGSIEVVNIAGHVTYQFTAIGLQELKQLATLGSPPSEMAKYFGVSEPWMKKVLLTELAIKESYEEGDAEGRVQLRKAGHDAAMGGDSRVLTFMMERRLGMNKVVEQTVTHKVNVIGTMPQHELPSGDWLSKFAPADVRTQQAISDAREGAQDVEPDADPNTAE